MDTAQLRAHNVLHGQTLIAEWQERARVCREAENKYNEARGYWAQMHACSITNYHRESHKLGAIAANLWAEGDRLKQVGNERWLEAVLTEFGDECTIWWYAENCTLSCGEVYVKIDYYGV